MKLSLPSVTLLCADSVNPIRSKYVLEYCKRLCDFGAVKLLTHVPIEYEHKIEIPPLNSIVAYSIFMLTKCHEYIETDHVLIVQRDGFILNPESWNPAWLNYDYIGPLFIEYDKVGSGGFSLRKKSLMKDISNMFPQWDWSQSEADRIQKIAGYYEDGVICLNGFNYNIAPIEEAIKFAQGGNRNPNYYEAFPFGFHGTHQNVDHDTGQVYPVSEGILNYDQLIDLLEKHYI